MLDDSKTLHTTIPKEINDGFRKPLYQMSGSFDNWLSLGSYRPFFFLIDMLIATSLTKMKTMTQLSQSILKILHLKSNKKFQLKIELSHCLYFFVPPQCHMPSVS